MSGSPKQFLYDSKLLLCDLGYTVIKLYEHHLCPLPKRSVTWQGVVPSHSGDVIQNSNVALCMT